MLTLKLQAFAYIIYVSVHVPRSGGLHKKTNCKVRIANKLASKDAQLETWYDQISITEDLTGKHTLSSLFGVSISISLSLSLYIYIYTYIYIYIYISSDEAGCAKGLWPVGLHYETGIIIITTTTQIITIVVTIILTVIIIMIIIIMIMNCYL